MLKEEVTRQPGETEKMRIEFAQRVFSNIQELIQFMDQKSGFVLAIVGLFCAALFTLIGVYLNGQLGTEKYLVATLMLWYLVHTGMTIWHSILVTRARPSVLGNKCNAPELIFPLMIMQKYQESDVNYLQALRRVEPLDIMADYSQQIIENSNIYRLKQHHLNKSVKQLLWSVLPWLILVIIIIANLVIPPIGAMPKIYILLAISLILSFPGWFLITKTSVRSR